MTTVTRPLTPPGTERPRRFRPRLRYELLGCALHGHELLGTDAAEVRPEDAIFVRPGGDVRWYRCLRCDSWLPLPPPSPPTAAYPPERDEVVLPLRGKPLRDRYVLRLIAVDRFVHVVTLTLLGVGILAFAGHKRVLHSYYVRILGAIQGGAGGPVHSTQHGVFAQLQHAFQVSTIRLEALGLLVLAYAALEAAEMVGLWFAKRWAEYLTFVATIVLVPFEIYELTHHVTALKIVTLVINLAIAVYLLLAKRLFGLRGGGAAEEAERARDIGWPALERATPGTGLAPA